MDGVCVQGVAAVREGSGGDKRWRLREFMYGGVRHPCFLYVVTAHGDGGRFG